MTIEEMLNVSAPPTLVVDGGPSSILRTDVGQVPGVSTMIGGLTNPGYSTRATAIRMAWSYNNMEKLIELAGNLAEKVFNTKLGEELPYQDAVSLEEFINELKDVKVHVY